MRFGRSAIVVLGVVGAIGAVYGGVELHRSARAAALASGLTDAGRPLVLECRWERPVTGGAARDCNGAAEERAAVVRLFADAQYDMIPSANLLDVVEQGRAPTASIDAFLASHGPALSTLHEATLCSWACVRDVSFQNLHRGTSRDAVDLLLVSAMAESPAVCFSRALDALRIELDEQTGVMGEGTYEAPSQRRRMHAIRRALLSCAGHADAATLESATRDAITIATAPPPVGDALAVQALTYSVSLVEAAQGRIWWGPLPWFQRGTVLDAADDLFQRIPRLRGYSDRELPALFDRLSHDEPPRRTALLGDRTKGEGDPSTNALLDVDAPLAQVLERHAHLDRDLRMLVIALAAMRDRGTRSAFSATGPSELAAPTLCDPLTGEAFAWTPGPGEGQATLLARAGRGEGSEAVALP